jgi:hypothetical protein
MAINRTFTTFIRSAKRARVAARNGTAPDLAKQDRDLDSRPKYAIPVAAPIAGRPILRAAPVERRERYDNAGAPGVSFSPLAAGGPAPLAMDQPGPVTTPPADAPPVAEDDAPADSFTIGGVTITKRNAMIAGAVLVLMLVLWRRGGK